MSDAPYTKGPVGPHLLTLSTTSAVGIGSLFLVDLVDMFFIALLGQPALAAAVGYAGAGLFFMASICIALSIAVSTLVGRALGADDEAGARHLATNGILLGLCLTVPATLASLAYATPLMALLGATDTTLTLAARYFSILNASLPVLVFSIVGSGLLRVVGAAKRSMTITLIGGGVNAVLDPIFIFVFDWGLDGAALASVASRMTVAGLALHALLRDHELITRPSVARIRHDLGPLASQAGPALLTNLSTPLGAAFVTSQMAQFGDAAVAAASVTGRITPVAFAGLFGLSTAVGPVASQNAGANRLARVNDTLVTSARYLVTYVLPVATLLALGNGVIVTAFDLSADAADLVRFFCIAITFSYLFSGLQFIASPIYSALNHPGYSTLANVGRDLLLTLPLVLLGASQLGAEGVMAGQAAAASLAGLLSFAVARRLIAIESSGHRATLSDWLHKSPCDFHRPVSPGIQTRGH
ncbi:MAG: MATE family efflux transporter [Pseudomonadota bacterium]